MTRAGKVQGLLRKAGFDVNVRMTGNNRLLIVIHEDLALELAGRVAGVPVRPQSLPDVFSPIDEARVAALELDLPTTPPSSLPPPGEVPFAGGVLSQIAEIGRTAPKSAVANRVIITFPDADPPEALEKALEASPDHPYVRSCAEQWERYGRLSEAQIEALWKFFRGYLPPWAPR